MGPFAEDEAAIPGGGGEEFGSEEEEGGEGGGLEGEGEGRGGGGVEKIWEAARLMPAKKAALAAGTMARGESIAPGNSSMGLSGRAVIGGGDGGRGALSITAKAGALVRSQVMRIPIDREYTLETLARLVQINSINPTLAPGAPGEREIAEFIAGSLRECGLTAEILEPEAGRTSVVGRLVGTGGGRSLMLNAHCDTVDVPGMAEPFSGSIREGKLYGRGAYDMKGSLAACMGAAKALKDAGVRLRGDVVVAAVADEEYGSLGTRDMIPKVRVDGAIVTEPTGLEVCLAHKGYLWMEVEVTGRAAHGSKFQYGIDANMKMGLFLARLSVLERELRGRTPHALVGPPSLHAAMVSGGSGLSTYAARSTVQIERRTVPGETAEGATAEIQAIVDGLAAEDGDFRATVRTYFVRDPFEVAESAGIVRAVDRAAAQVRGKEAAHIGDTPWMDAALLQAAGVETVVCGAGGTGAHADVEWVDVESVVELAEILAVAAVEYCG